MGVIEWPTITTGDEIDLDERYKRRSEVLKRRLGALQSGEEKLGAVQPHC